MILLWGLAEDTPLAYVRQALQDLKAPVVLVDQRKVLETSIELCVGGSVEGTIHMSEQEVDLAEVTAVYLRPYGSDRLPVVREASRDGPELAHAIAVDDTIFCWTEVTAALIVNRPSAMASNESKPYQLSLIGSHGFLVPDTLITTDPQAVREFWSEHGMVVYKSISGVRSIVSRLTNRDLTRLEQVVWCPTQFQQYIPGLDYRVHVVGDEVFSCEVVSEADDYRYAGNQAATVDIRACEVPADISDRCRALTAGLGLRVAGIDLRRRPDGRWFCFEVNPSPAFSYYQAHTAQPISEAIARLLAVEQ